MNNLWLAIALVFAIYMTLKITSIYVQIIAHIKTGISDWNATILGMITSLAWGFFFYLTR